MADIIKETTNVRIEDIIQLAFDVEAMENKKALNKKIGKQITEEMKEKEKEILIWMMKFVNKTGGKKFKVSYHCSKHIDTLTIEQDDKKATYEELSWRIHIQLAFKDLIQKMEARKMAKANCIYASKDYDYEVFEIRFL